MLEQVKDSLYKRSSEGENKFSGLLEIIKTRENIIDAIRQIKSNGGFKTAGVDKMTGQEFLALDAETAFQKIVRHLDNYTPKNVRRVLIPKQNGKLRPLGIPTIVDRIIQTAITNIIEPILEAKMYEHSYGFRPLRAIEHASAYLSVLTTHNKRHFVVEGDIKSFFDRIDHKIMIRKLYKYGIADKRVLSIIKKMLKAGIEGIKNVNEKGTPQGGTISTLLANVYLTDFDHWVDKQWRNFKTLREFKVRNKGHDSLRNHSSLKEGYLIRYADDWVILTNTRENAERWKHACKKFLQKELKIELSDEKTKITDLRENHMDFLGYRYFKRPNGKNGNWTLRSEPIPERLIENVNTLRSILTEMKKSKTQNELIVSIFKYNSIARGIRNFYKHATLVNIVLSHHDYQLYARQRAVLKPKGSEIVSVKKCINLTHLHKQYGDSRTIAFRKDGLCLGLEKLSWIKFKPPLIKAQWITPYTAEGRSKIEQLTGKKFSTLPRNPHLTLGDISSLLAKHSKFNQETIYNLEYFINRPLAFNRDRAQCKYCNIALTGFGDTEIHHINTALSLDKINKLPNLVTLCVGCHIEEHRERRKTKAKESRSRPLTRGIASKTGNIAPTRTSRKPDKETLTDLVKTTSYVKIGEKYGVSGNAVKKWAISYDIHELRMHKKPRRI